MDRILLIAMILLVAVWTIYVIYNQAWLPPLEAAKELDYQKYEGKWYEISAFPCFWELECTGQTATYTLNDQGGIDVLNACYLNTLQGPLVNFTGTAIQKGSLTSQLCVTFKIIPFLCDDYWVLDIDPNYQWVIVGAPSRRYLWILARTPHIDDVLYDSLVEKAAVKLFNVKDLYKAVQP